jgi:hypothetical protein
MRPFRKSDLEGYVCIDHRESPGLASRHLPVGAGSFFEGKTNTCRHCQKIVIMNPDRIRNRFDCPGCDHFICDGCALIYKITGVCRPFDQVLAEAHERAVKGLTV